MANKINRRKFGGAVTAGWHAYNITTNKDYGIGDWSDQQIADYLSFGHAAGRGSASGPMGEAVGNSLQYLTADDTHSLVLYLRHVEPQTGVPGTEVDPAPGTMTASSAWAPGASDAQGELGHQQRDKHAEEDKQQIEDPGGSFGAFLPG